MRSSIFPSVLQKVPWDSKLQLEGFLICGFCLNYFIFFVKSYGKETFAELALQTTSGNASQTGPSVVVGLTVRVDTLLLGITDLTST